MMKHSRTYTMIRISFFAGLMVICSWISVPMVIPFTLQTFAYFLMLIILGGKESFTTVCIYFLLGIIGLPVFSGFHGGIGVFFGSTGGFLLGFLLGAAIVWIIDGLTDHAKKGRYFGAGLSMCVYFLAGAIWFSFVTTGTISLGGFSTAVLTCVVPFILPDIMKLILAVTISKRINLH